MAILPCRASMLCDSMAPSWPFSLRLDRMATRPALALSYMAAARPGLAQCFT